MNIALNTLKTRLVATTLIFSMLASPAFAKEAQPGKDLSLTEQASEYVRDYLSDKRRAGSLAGSILGGALFAHPFGPVLGSLVGFFIGKQTMFEEEKAQKQEAPQQLARRDIVPQDGKSQGLPTLSFADPQGITFDTPAASAAAAAAAAAATGATGATGTAFPATASTAPMIAPDRIPIPMAVPTISRDQIATMCGCCQAHLEPRLRSLCFYYQGSWQSDKKPAGPVVSLAAP